MERFLAEAAEQTSTWDMYIGVTPFLEMIQMVESDVIEPWDPYLPEGLLDSMIAPIREEGSYNGQFYVWPFLLDVIVQGWNSEIVEAAGLDPEVAPTTWDEYLANAQKIVDSGAAPFGCTFDYHAWRSLLPITHSISLDVYDPETGSVHVEQRSGGRGARDHEADDAARQPGRAQPGHDRRRRERHA